MIHAFEWLNPREKASRAALQSFLIGAFGDPVEIAMGTPPVANKAAGSERFTYLLERAQELVVEEGFLNWQVAFPSVWSDWAAAERYGGFDAVIGNPPPD